MVPRCCCPPPMRPKRKAEGPPPQLGRILRPYWGAARASTELGRFLRPYGWAEAPPLRLGRIGAFDDHGFALGSGLYRDQMRFTSRPHIGPQNPMHLHHHRTQWNSLMESLGLFHRSMGRKNMTHASASTSSTADEDQIQPSQKPSSTG